MWFQSVAGISLFQPFFAVVKVETAASTEIKRVEEKMEGETWNVVPVQHYPLGNGTRPTRIIRISYQSRSVNEYLCSPYPSLLVIPRAQLQ